MTTMNVASTPQIHNWTRVAQAAATVTTAEVAASLDQFELSAAPSQTPPAAEAPVAPLEARFREAFFTDYEARFCGKNIRRFVVNAPDSLEMEGAKVLAIENKGCSWFGMVRAMHARDVKGNGEPYATDRNWYHHVILEKDGRIYDFDYGITPQAPTVQDYFEKMFLNCDKVRPHQKLADYELQVIDAREYGDAKKDTSSKVTMGQYLEGWGVNLERYQVAEKPRSNVRW